VIAGSARHPGGDADFLIKSTRATVKTIALSAVHESKSTIYKPKAKEWNKMYKV
jgi:hypothetical protein